MMDLYLKYGDFKDFIGNTPTSKFNPNGVPIIETITAHNLRHTFATMLYFAVVDILTAKEHRAFWYKDHLINLYSFRQPIQSEKHEQTQWIFIF